MCGYREINCDPSIWLAVFHKIPIILQFFFCAVVHCSTDILKLMAVVTFLKILCATVQQQCHIVHRCYASFSNTMLMCRSTVGNKQSGLQLQIFKKVAESTVCWVK